MTKGKCSKCKKRRDVIAFNGKLYCVPCADKKHAELWAMKKAREKVNA